MGSNSVGCSGFARAQGSKSASSSAARRFASRAWTATTSPRVCTRAPLCSMPTIVAPSAAGIMPFYADYSGPAMSESQAAFIDHKQPKRAAVSCSHSHSAILPVHTAQFLPITGGVLPRIRRAAAGDGAGGAADGAPACSPRSRRSRRAPRCRASSPRRAWWRRRSRGAARRGERAVGGDRAGGAEDRGAVPTYLDTCSKFAAEASRVRNAGRRSSAATTPRSRERAPAPPGSECAFLFKKSLSREEFEEPLER